ncbi:helix-turn-helix domain-containing protein [Corynebacterium variabile]|uniref:helix-turn-helix domain-containing protein n=1 Tax=Corynebacterium variabile TaxID=1727 RepID=UPI003FCF7462
MSIATAAGAFEVSTRTVQRMVAAGAVPVLNIGRATRVRVSDIEKACTLFPAVDL